MTIHNSSLDIDNAQKLALDAIKGILIVDDRRKHLRAIWAEHAVDDEEPRIDIEVESCDPLPPRQTKRKRPIK